MNELLENVGLGMGLWAGYHIITVVFPVIKNFLGGII